MDEKRENVQPRRRHGGPMGGSHGMGMPVEKPKNLKASLSKLAGYCKSYLPAVIITLILAAFGTTLQIIGPDKLKDITNEIQKGLTPEGVSAEDITTFFSGEESEKTDINRFIESGFITINENGIPVFSANSMPVLITDENGESVFNTDQVPPGKIDIEAITKIGLLLVFFYLCSAVFNFIQQFMMATITQKISKKLRTDITKKIDRLPFKYFDKTSVGNVLSRVSNDVDTIGMTLNQSIGTVVTSVTMIAGSLVMMFYNNWILAICAILSSFLGFILMIVIMKKSQGFFVEQQNELGNMNGHIEEIYSGHNVVKAYNGGKAAKKTFEEINDKLYISGWKSQFMSGLMMPFMGFIGNLGFVIVCVVGSVLVLNNVITFGVIVAFMIYIRLFTQPLSQLAQAAQNLQRTAAASERVFEFFEEEELEDESSKEKTLVNVKGNVEFKNVKFGYDINKTIIHDFSAKAQAGQKIAIVGPTGAGKTTMVNLLMRFYELDGGEILLDDIPINKVTRENVHEQFCMVLQDTWLFEGTIKENIIYSKHNVSDEEVVKACKAAGLHHFIKTLPSGYDTMLNDKASLSAGQKQLITIARAMIQNSPLLILDEATSSVDTRTEILIQEAMDKLMKGRTSFIIAHRLSTIKNADLILVMKDGDIIESGSHEDLLIQNGFYAELYNSQFDKVS